MASIQNAVQVMVDKLVADMEGNQPLTAEEQALVSNAITKLTDNAKLEQAVVAVAESHINDATSTLQQVSQSSGAALQSATESLTQTSATLDTKSSKLDLLDSMAPNLNRVESLQASSNALHIRPLFGMTPIDSPSTSSNNRRATGIFAVYDNSGDTYAIRPSFSHNGTTEQCRLEYLKLNSNAAEKTTTHTSFVHTNAFEQNPASKIYYYGTSAYLPLASKSNAADIQYEIVYSTQDSQTTAIANYGGIFCKSSGFTSITKPKQNLDAIDQFGISTATTHAHHQVGVLYDNNKHCLVMVDEGTSVLVEKYRDGNVVTTTAIANNEELQAYVDAGDFTVVKFLYHSLQHANGRHYYNHSETPMSSYGVSYYGYFGHYNGVTKMGENKFSAHYRFTHERRLEPLNYFFSCSTGHYNAHNSPDAETKVILETMSGEILGAYSYHSRPYHAAYDNGLMGGVISCINPYSGAGILNEHYTYNNYGLGRTCRAF
ncbi:hypothetical protein [Pseudoalteromonas luteoviolacea]|uniref:Uncharacterized protein n=1 Tax=Pseudoalteromonas luteoviolacea S4054 TaxID=1129367 RepID=A0A0F6A4J4_9GAMM|nr:hypothetical protein [Pseudoalteromonas luteoviolacea]AOT09351.1 hypothetical protein S4054249_16510 [Pseudoalteromonas luteoviolacea]AOT14263.1 hypothetical protein S40542_16480 [Pseudoalteromonas luteoviolacea]AOT19179.1 hypothetical protein S4054_16485 [Pseudoalteromonas luteoviolacea]KKE81135.1 hypothetical protein N479_23665 [Pseudoalteromonas luteoviolacea S4054]KZN73452.1 hypothetical protein N481_12080 [Pseudoalteromonas luteoviolacea S4047-1]